MSTTDIPTRNIRTKNDTTHESVGASMRAPTSEHDSAYDVGAEQRLIEFVESQITKMRQYAKLGNGKEASFYEVNEALMSYQDTLLALLAMHNTSKIEYIRAKEAFEDWYAQKYILIREEMNPRSLSAQKWYSQKEIEMMVRQKYNDEYKRLSWNVNLTEQQLSFLRRLLEGWNTHQYILTQLSRNLIAEVNGMGVESALNQSSNV
ncbi:MAG: hypothetical protein LC687_03315 [Actinobacteria bacterium]|nr:hypothetical protein [Actinomycetota bacterium]